MIIEQPELVGLEAELSYLDEIMDQFGFIRWQWEYYRATYDFKLRAEQEIYYVRIHTRVKNGKLEQPDTILRIEAIYMGRATFPRGLDYKTPIPQAQLCIANKKLQYLKEALYA